MPAYLLGFMVFVGSSCSTGLEDEHCGESVELTTMTYNLANASGQTQENLAGHIASIAPDFVAVQECGDCEELIGRLPSRYALSASPRSGVTTVYDSSTWKSTDEDFFRLGLNDDGWGERVLQWARFEHLDTGHCVNVFSTHWCVSVRSPDDACNVERQLAYTSDTLSILDSHSSERAPAILAGDFNVFDDFENGRVVEELAGSLRDVYRAHMPAGDATTFQGNEWAPAGRIDYIFASEPVEVLDSYIDKETLEGKAASDHYPVIGQLRFEVSE
jgi:endonuclease/exonuclease/phosphatase family metal-dependent hydrolase